MAQPKTIEELKQAARKIDISVASFYRQKKLPVPQTTDDATYLRRAFLVSIGRIPTIEEARAFLEMNDPKKREDLVSYLLDSKGYGSHMSNWAFDLLRLSDGKDGTSATNEPYREWVRASIEQNMPWHEFVNALLASKGDGWDQKTAAVGYYTRDRGMPLDNIANSMRIFLGSRMECAQCHDDPFGDAERKDFYKLAAFTNGQNTLNQEYMRPLWDEFDESTRRKNSDYAIAQILWDKVYGMSLGGGGDGRIALPSDYQYRDAQPGEVIGAYTPFGKTLRMSPNKAHGDGRIELARWVTTRTGEQFPTVIANRMWKRIMGRGIYEPIDEYIPKEKTHAPELLAQISTIMQELNYDLRAFQKVLMFTQTFQFATNPNPSSLEDGDDFHGRKIERLSAEMIWDSLITLANGNPDLLPRRTMDERIYLHGKPILQGKKSMPQLSQEVLALQSDREVRAYFKNLVAEINSGSRSGDAPSMSMMGKAMRYNSNDQVRASELPSPAPRSHFLYLFGQSERDVVEASSREPNVGQVLSLMNGFVQKKLVNNPNAHLYNGLTSAKTDEEKIRRIYIAVLNRPPTATEMTWMKDEIQQSGPEQGLRNIVSALVMSAEFLFLQ